MSLSLVTCTLYFKKRITEETIYKSIPPTLYHSQDGKFELIRTLSKDFSDMYDV